MYKKSLAKELIQGYCITRGNNVKLYKYKFALFVKVRDEKSDLAIGFK